MLLEQKHVNSMKPIFTFFFSPALYQNVDEVIIEMHQKSDY